MSPRGQVIYSLKTTAENKYGKKRIKHIRLHLRIISINIRDVLKNQRHIHRVTKMLRQLMPLKNQYIRRLSQFLDCSNLMFKSALYSCCCLQFLMFNVQTKIIAPVFQQKYLNVTKESFNVLSLNSSLHPYCFH